MNWAVFKTVDHHNSFCYSNRNYRFLFSGDVRLQVAPYLVFLSSFRPACNQGRLTTKGGLYFSILSKGIDHAQSFLLRFFFDQTLFFTFSSLQHHVHIRHMQERF